MEDIIEATHGSSLNEMDTDISIVEQPSVSGRTTANRLTRKAERSPQQGLTSRAGVIWPR
jgi:hypothetical protein